ncbi:MAG: hypothetical protein ABIR33_13660 [Pyrinomonadaceae bacterium]
MPLATKHQVLAELWNHGFFSGFDEIVRKYGPDAREAGSFKSYLFELISREIAEAKKETVRLQGALDRVEAKCRQGRINPGNPTAGWDANTTGLRNDIQAIDGWTVSLFESDITLLHYILGLETAGNRSKTLHASMNVVMEKRRSELSLSVSDPSAFKLKIV